MTFTAQDWVGFQRRLNSKVRFHVGNYCPDVDDLVQETLARFQRAISEDAVRKPESIGAYLSGICNNVISHMVHDGFRSEREYQAAPGQ